MATVTKGPNADEGDLTITPSEGEQFTVGDGTDFSTNNPSLLAALAGEVEAGRLKIDHSDASDADADRAEAKEVEKQARARAREIKRGVPGDELTVPGEPDETPTTPVDDGGGNS